MLPQSPLKQLRVDREELTAHLLRPPEPLPAVGHLADPALPGEARVLRLELDQPL